MRLLYTVHYADKGSDNEATKTKLVATAKPFPNPSDQFVVLVLSCVLRL